MHSHSLHSPRHQLSIVSVALVLLLIFVFVAPTAALVTLGDVEELRNVTLRCRDEILRSVELGLGSGLGGEGVVTGQAVIIGEGKGEEVEDTVSAALKTVDARLLEILNVPLATFDSFQNEETPSCLGIIDDYHSFLKATVLFLRKVEEQQQLHRWGGISPVFDNLAWLQSLWASRRPNEQNRSFIEQQMALYSSTGCFTTNEVLRRGVEMVEYMNDMIDSFDA